MILDTVIIELPLPPRELSPNRPPATRGSRMKKHRATVKYRATARILAMQQLRGQKPRWQKAVAQLHFRMPDNRRRDIRNYEAAMKAAYDGIVDAGVMVDDSWQHLRHEPTTVEVAKPGGVTITVWEDARVSQTCANENGDAEKMDQGR